MAFTVPNAAAAPVHPAGFDDQAEPEKVDWDIVAAGIQGDGVIDGCAVTAQGTPDMTVAVAAGNVFIAGVSYAVTAGNLTIGAADATNARIELITVDNAGAKAVVAGTANANACMPAIPANRVVLAAVYVPAGDTAIQGNQITDKRVFIAADVGIKHARPKQGATTYYSVPGVGWVQGSTFAWVVNKDHFYPFVVHSAVTLDQLAIEVTTAGAAGKTMRLGIYKADQDWQPGALVLDAGTVAVDTTGVKTIAISQTLTPGRYLLAAASDGTPDVRQYQGFPPEFSGVIDTMGASFAVATVKNARTYAAFPDPGTAWTEVVTAGGPFRYHVFCRVSTP